MSFTKIMIIVIVVSFLFALLVQLIAINKVKKRAEIDKKKEYYKNKKKKK